LSVALSTLGQRLRGCSVAGVGIADEMISSLSQLMLLSLLMLAQQHNEYVYVNDTEKNARAATCLVSSSSESMITTTTSDATAAFGRATGRHHQVPILRALCRHRHKNLIPPRKSFRKCHFVNVKIRGDEIAQKGTSFCGWCCTVHMSKVLKTQKRGRKVKFRPLFGCFITFFWPSPFVSGHSQVISLARRRRQGLFACS
jgi:hypothetical protein